MTLYQDNHATVKRCRRSLAKDANGIFYDIFYGLLILDHVCAVMLSLEYFMWCPMR